MIRSTEEYTGLESRLYFGEGEAVLMNRGVLMSRRDLEGRQGEAGGAEAIRWEVTPGRSGDLRVGWCLFSMGQMHASIAHFNTASGAPPTESPPFRELKEGHPFGA